MDITNLSIICKKLVEQIDCTKPIDFKQIIEFEPDLAEVIEDGFQDFSDCLSYAYTDRHNGIIIPRIKNLTNSFNLGVGSIREEHIGKFKQFEGIVVKVGDVKAIPYKIKFTCPACGNEFTIVQEDDTPIVPKQCNMCKRKGKLTEDITWKNIQYIVIEEYICDYIQRRVRPATTRVMLTDELTSPKLTKQIQPGKHIILTGEICANQTDKKRAIREFEIKANHIIIEDVSLFNLKVPEKYIEQFKKVDKAFLLSNLSESIFSRIKGYREIKEILTISRARGVKTYYPDGKLDQRDTINVFMCSSPGAAKSDLAKMALKIDVIGMVVSGKGVSGVGLTGSTSYDKQLGNWIIEPGAVPRCDKGSIVIDELDKIDDKDTAALNEGMVNLSFMISKANQQITLPCDVSIIGCANPDGRQFSPMIEKYRQITLKPDFLDRFDIWVALEKKDDYEEQKGVIGKIIDRFRTKEDAKPFSDEFVRYYFAWIIQNFKPEIPTDLIPYTTDRIMDIMGGTRQKKEVSYRIVGNIIRFSLALAKIYQENEVKKEHIDKAIELFIYSFASMDMMDSGKISVERINFEMPVQEKLKKYALIDLIRARYSEKKSNLTYMEIVELWTNEGHTMSEAEQIIQRLSQIGEMIEVTRGQFKPVD